MSIDEYDSIWLGNNKVIEKNGTVYSGNVIDNRCCALCGYTSNKKIGQNLRGR